MQKGGSNLRRRSPRALRLTSGGAVEGRYRAVMHLLGRYWPVDASRTVARAARPAQTGRGGGRPAVPRTAGTVLADRVRADVGRR